MIDRSRRAVAWCAAVVAAACGCGLWLLPERAVAQLQVDIIDGVTAPIPLAIEDFAEDPQAAAGVIRQDLGRSGRFVIGARTASDYLLAGRAALSADGRITYDYELTNLLTGQRLLREQVVAAPASWRNAAHRISDRIHLAVIGSRSAFATRIAYVSVDGVPPTRRYQLVVADADGENPRVVLRSRLPLMSPAWSPDGESLAYVSFETRAAAVYVQKISSAERRRVSGRAGVNNAPAWSPDGRRLALTLSSLGGNLDVHVLDLASGQLLRVTDHPAIDTEPVWSPDGSRLFFTSDRAGGPQVYRAAPEAGAAAQRITFLGPYNARPRVSPDGRLLAHVTRSDGAYRIAVQDLIKGGVRVLSRGGQDESPAFSPDGGTLIFATREGNQGVLATVGLDGARLQGLTAVRGEVREPAWGPFLP